MLRDRKDRRALIWLAFISIITHLGWLVTFQIFTSGDWWHISLQRYHDFAHFSPIWVTDGLGSTSAVPHFYLIRFLEGVLTYFGSSFMLNEKLFFFIPMTFGASIGTYLLVRQYFSAWPAFVGAIVFSFNTAYLFDHVGPLTIGVAYALAPWCIYMFKRYIDGAFNLRLLILTALAFSVTAAYELRITLIVAAICMGLFVFNIFAGEGLRYFKQRLLPLAGLGLLVLLLHAFWILPYAISSKSVTFSDLLTRGLFVSFSDIQNSLTLYHPFWTGSRPATFIIQAIPLYAWLVPVAAFGGFVFRSRQTNKEIYYWGILAVLGLFLVKQVNEPFTNIYPWLFQHVPGFGAFRESSKFYVLIALSYAVLIPYTLVTLKEWADTRTQPSKEGTVPRQLIYMTASIVVLLLFLVNTKPLLTGEFRTLYIPRHIPKDYAVLEAFINKQSEHFRTLWVPVTSRWSIQTNSHPAIQATNVNQGGWLGELGDMSQKNYTTLRDKAVGLLTRTSSDAALDRAGVKYVIVPLRDTDNEDDFFRYYGDDRNYYIEQLNALPYLKRINIGTHDLVVYENQNYKQHVDTATSIQSFPLSKDVDIDTLYDFIANQTGTEFNFVAEQEDNAPGAPPTYPLTKVTNIFQGMQPDNIQKDAITRTIPTASNPKLFTKSDYRSLYYTIEQGMLSLFAKQQGGLSINRTPIDAPNLPDSLLTSLRLDPRADYILGANGTPLPLQVKESTRNLGVVRGPLNIFAISGGNIVPNGSFEEGLWQQKVKDCNAYDSQPIIAMAHATDATDGVKSLQLESDRHTACTESTALPHTVDNYMLQFDYKVFGGRTAGYEVIFDDKAHTVTRQDLTVPDGRWQKYQKIITVPEGATSFKLRFLGYPDYRLQMHSVTNYDNVRLTPLTTLYTLPQTTGAYQQLELPKYTPLTISYPYQPTQQGNLVPNGSFDKGLWQKQVADCNAFDTQPDIGMDLAGHGSGKALELVATRHTACTSNNAIPIHENTAYLFTMDYQSPGASSASYYLRFNDVNRTTVEEHIPIKDSKWHTFAKQIKAPLGATKVSIVVYAEATGTGNNTTINRYDNFGLHEIPDVVSQYYIVDTPTGQLSAPKNITFHSTSATSASVRVKGAATPFYLTMAEAYHPLWRLRLDSGGFGLRNMLPWTVPAGTVADTSHFKLNDFQNGWYVDPAKLCAGGNKACKQNADGSYNLNMALSFAPQRWFYAGSVVSGLTLVACIGYLTYARRQSKRAEGKRFVLWR